MAHDDGRRVRLRDVAERAGVSVGSASQAFGWPELVSEETRKRVLAAADARLSRARPCGAAPADRARGRRRPDLLGAPRVPVHRSDRSGVPARDRPRDAGGTDRSLLIPDSRYRDEAARTVREAAVDGFVIYSAAQNDPRVEAALARRLPVVTVDQPRGAATPFVGIDDRAAARSAAEHLRELGHERVAVLSFITALDLSGTLELDLSVERLEGYKEGLGEAWDPTLVRTCRPNAPEPAREATIELLREPNPRPRFSP